MTVCGVVGGVYPQQSHKPPFLCTHCNSTASYLGARYQLGLKIRSFYHHLGFEALRHNDTQSAPAGSENNTLLLSQKAVHTWVWREGVGPDMTKGGVDSPLVVNTMKCFSLRKLMFWSCRDLSVCEKRKKNEDPFKRRPSPPWFSEPPLLNAISPLLLLPLCVGLGFTFPVCFCDTAHSSWHVGLVLSDRLEGLQSLCSVVSHSSRSTGFLSKIAAPWLLCSGHNWSVSGLQFIPHLTC